MQNVHHIVGLVFIELILMAHLSNAQWQPDVRLTNGPSNSIVSMNNARCIGANGNYVYAVWADDRLGYHHIYYKRSTDGGINWGADTRLTANSAFEYHPCITVLDSVLHVAWFDYRNGNSEIYYKRSTNNGLNWGSDKRLTSNSANSQDPSAAVSDSVVHLAWYDERDGNGEIYYKRSSDRGVNWGPDTRLSNDTAYSYLPSIAVSGSAVHVTWEDKRDGNWNIYYRRSTDGGLSWQAETALTNHDSDSFRPSVSAQDSTIIIVWEDHRDGNPEIYYKRSTDNGYTWGADTRLTQDTAQSGLCSVHLSGSFVHVVWRDDRDGDDEVYYKLSTDRGISWGSDIRLTEAPGTSDMSSCAVSGATLHIVWNDDRDGNMEIYYKRNPTGNTTIGINSNHHNSPIGFQLYQNYPNPFNPGTTIRFELSHSAYTSLKIYNLMGQQVATLVNDYLTAGYYTREWNASGMASGIYFYILQSGKRSQTKKLLLMK